MESTPNQDGAPTPEGVFSLLDTDLYKLTMQCCVLKYFPDVEVTYNLTNRTPDMKFSRRAFKWLQKQIDRLANIGLSADELNYLKTTCTYLTDQHIRYLSTFRLQPSKQVHLSFHPLSSSSSSADSDDQLGDIALHTTGLWVETILYEIPLLALISETYFKFRDTDWDYAGQTDRARAKGRELLRNGCVFSEFGSRRRRDYRTQELVLRGLLQARDEGAAEGWEGRLAGTSNVHFAMKFGVPPVGTVAHEWFMGVAAITNDYEGCSEIALRYWVATFGEGVLGIALTDTYGTETFLKAFRQPVPRYTAAMAGASTTTPSSASETSWSPPNMLSGTRPPIEAITERPDGEAAPPAPSYAQVFTGVRQDSGDPLEFVRLMRAFYDGESIADKKVIVFSDSLNIELCLKYKRAAEEKGFATSFGVGTFLTNDFTRKSSGDKSTPLNIVIKLGSAAGRPAVKISDNIGKNTGDEATVAEVKRRLGYHEKAWAGGDEAHRWG
ncbi:nicotinate phosphoribosyltransferase [Lineolata rhizophorae]|uniref:nicotinate phosphoribosyltransferase n=1 Tax=Lineolata rhizophorae TaxID=578093 RepID=A0A6A6NQW7_9PEZI|nr:nicotinate phosphoribosyltransferase [Lineolata rhizophorae]